MVFKICHTVAHLVLPSFLFLSCYKSVSSIWHWKITLGEDTYFKIGGFKCQICTLRKLKSMLRSSNKYLKKMERGLKYINFTSSYPVSYLNSFLLGRAKYASNGRGRNCSVTTGRTLQVKYTFPLLGELQFKK